MCKRGCFNVFYEETTLRSPLQMVSIYKNPFTGHLFAEFNSEGYKYKKCESFINRRSVTEGKPLKYHTCRKKKKKTFMFSLQGRLVKGLL